ncbi:MAG: peptidoglycan-binding domain-containing protein [Candidatus Omnitrophica bacterium]|nr:peptidoglycan-binding domain-containing protein [Candidatus Omnitrophota bacterium]
MKKILLLLMASGLIFAGCQTTQKYQPQTDELTNRVHLLENNINKKDQEISRLYDKINGLTKQIEEKNNQLTKLTEPKKLSPEVLESKDGLGIIRVNATPAEIQIALKNAGYYEGNVDGKIGPNTINAISNFQKDNGLTPDSVVGSKTWETLKTFK